MQPNAAILSIDNPAIIARMPSPKTKAIIIRVSEEDHRVFTDGADADDSTISEWFRRLGKKRLKELGIVPKKLPKKAAK